MTATPTTTTRYFFGKCKACGAARHEVEEMMHSAKRFSYPVDGGRFYSNEKVKCMSIKCKCGNEVRAAKRLTVRMSDHKCDARCTHATGNICDCSCGGKNHGVAQ